MTNITKEEIKEFLKSKPGYLKEGAKRLKKHLSNKDLYATLNDCKNALREVRVEIKLNPEFKKEEDTKILLYDIETAYGLARVWNPGWKLNVRYSDFVKMPRIICISYKWAGSDEVHTVSWDKNQDDKLLLEEFIKELNKSDFSIGHNCVTEDTKVLKDDLTWVDAGSLKIGEELVGFEEGNSDKCRVDGKWIGSEGKHRKFKKSIITGYEKKVAPVYRITFDDGTFVDTTNDHKWLGTAPKDKNHRWYTTEYLKEGYKCLKPFNTWEVQNTYNSGYISGMIDADGSVSKDGGYNISIYQSDKKNKDICSKIENILEKENIDYSEDFIETSKIISTTYKGQEKIKYPTHSTSHVYRFLGDVYDKLALIGKYKIQKGLRNFSSDNLGAVKMNKNRLKTIVSKEYVGDKTIVVMQTSTKTFIGNGFMMHNCDKFDLPWIKARAAYHGLPMYPKYTSVDTLKIARYQFKFPSNRLDDLGDYLGVGRKIETDRQLWVDTVCNGSREALDRMVKYCEQDVFLLEDVYDKLKSYTLPTTHNGVLNNKTKLTSPYNGSTNIELVKTISTKAGTIKKLMKCLDTGQYFEMSNSTYKKFKEVNN